jgi:cysteine desulfurase
MQIYLDYSATTAPRPEIVSLIQEMLTQQWGNPSSLHHWGQRAANVLERARIQVASLIHAPNPESIIFTSGGTEADNLAIFGITQRYKVPQHLIISSVEHSAVAEPARRLEERGWQVTRLPVNRQGRVNPLDLKAALQGNTVLVSVIYGQSEVGTLQPIAELAPIARARGVLFHTDAVQVAGRLPLDVQSLPIDLLSLSGHKIYGTQGAGALYLREGVELLPMLAGGGQEWQLRSGTQAVPAIAAFGLAASLAAAEMSRETPRLIRLRDHLFDLLERCTYLQPTGDRHDRLPHHLSFLIDNGYGGESISGRALVRQLNYAGIGISAGSACNSGKLAPNPVLLAMGYRETEAVGGIRLTLGRDTTEADIDWTAMVINQVLERLMPRLLTVT